VPLLFNERKELGWHAIMATMMAMLEHTRDEHEAIAQKILDMAGDDVKLQANVRAYLTTSMNNATANYQYRCVLPWLGLADVDKGKAV
jgi:hypothetical protein